MYFFLPFSFLFPFLPPPPRPFRTRFFFLPFRPLPLKATLFARRIYRCSRQTMRLFRETLSDTRQDSFRGRVDNDVCIDGFGWMVELGCWIVGIPRYQSLLSFSRSPPASECSIHPFRKRNTRVFGRNEGNGNKQAKGVNKRERVKKGMRTARGMQTERV